LIVDGSFAEATGQASVGIVIWDHLGQVLSGKCYSLPGGVCYSVPSAEETELAVRKKGLSFSVGWIQKPSNVSQTVALALQLFPSKELIAHYTQALGCGMQGTHEIDGRC